MAGAYSLSLLLVLVALHGGDSALHTICNAGAVPLHCQ
jgi:hypothetical protein